MKIQTAKYTINSPQVKLQLTSVSWASETECSV